MYMYIAMMFVAKKIILYFSGFGGEIVDFILNMDK